MESENSSWPSRAFDIRRSRDRVRDVTRRAGHGARREFPRVRRRRDRRRTRSRSRRRVAPERRRRRRGVPIPKRRPPRRVGGGCRGIVRRGVAPGAGQIRARARSRQRIVRCPRAVAVRRPGRPRAALGRRRGPTHASVGREIHERAGLAGSAARRAETRRRRADLERRRRLDRARARYARHHPILRHHPDDNQSRRGRPASVRLSARVASRRVRLRRRMRRKPRQLQRTLRHAPASVPAGGGRDEPVRRHHEARDRTRAGPERGALRALRAHDVRRISGSIRALRRPGLGQK